MKTNSLFRKAGVWLAAFMALLIAGCGGSGGGASSPVSLFLTDDLNTGYDAVWVKVKKVELVGAASPSVVFDSPTGVVANVRALNSGGIGKFLFMGDDKVPKGVYTGIKITLAADVVLFPTGSNTGLDRTFAGLDASNNKVLSADFAAPIDTSMDDTRFVVDFKLEDWTDDGTFIQGAVIVIGSNNGLDDPSRHEDNKWHGTISGLAGTAPDFTFTLNAEHGNKVLVKTNVDTSIYNANGSPNPVLRNGARVQVRGKFSPNDGAVIAASIKIVGNENEGPHEIEGEATDPDAEAGTFMVELRRCEGFLPGVNHVKVHVDIESTRFTSHGGVVLTYAEFFAILATHPGIKIEAHGTLNTAGETIFEATSVKVDDEDGHEGAEAKGGVVSINAVDFSFEMELAEWEGFSGHAGQHINVTTSGETTFRNADGAQIDQAAFFALLVVGNNVEVHGQFNEGVLAARSVKIDDRGHNEDEARGTVLLIIGEQSKFDMALTEWSGFDGENGMLVHVDASGGGVTFRDEEGESITREAFFIKIIIGATVEVKGTFNAQTQTLTAVRCKLED